MHDSRMVAQADSPDMWSNLTCQSQSQKFGTMLLKWVIMKEQISDTGIHKLQDSTEFFFTLETTTSSQLLCEVFNNPVATYQQMQGREYTE